MATNLTAPGGKGIDYIALINALAPLVINLAPVVAQMINSVQAQTGKEATAILAEVGPQLDEDERKLLADLAADTAAAGGAK